MGRWWGWWRCDLHGGGKGDEVEVEGGGGLDGSIVGFPGVATERKQRHKGGGGKDGGHWRFAWPPLWTSAGILEVEEIRRAWGLMGVWLKGMGG